MTAPHWFRDWLGRTERLESLQLFFVLGCQKSGTTWLQRLLHAHPQVVCRGEGHLADTLHRIQEHALNVYNQSQTERGRTDHRFLLTDDDVRGTLRLLFAQILRRYLDSADDCNAVRALGDKTPEHALSIPMLAEMFPGSRFIHIIRDGRDGAVSGWAHLQRAEGTSQFATFADYAAYFAERHWKPYILNAHNAGCALPGRVMEIRYEDLHADPVPWTQRMLRFINVDDDVNAASACIDAASFDQLSGGRRAGVEDRNSHFRKGIVGDWRTHFDAEAQARFNKHAGDLLAQLGYADDADSLDCEAYPYAKAS